ncbi:hypothetical protein SARC_01850 [Sphaeroforma arctica JP610]|uniref:Uncharacterized protein n=1 Tax=Sphaeroforma arctica JP610 TaxID=667725 RepID=A0A0L0GAI8_9EUKA|nr:hypothetical protein SARC_01850 [Sphaeroforma arctica JP610]KNC86005.1 hypothetical protein SARC_01850 [Sphaeroforma arctica JP610]|eukprot:XP_014159907.1 hypothetical protein SARC_01850 [Sphaeroforma arctica JP610]
MHICLVADTRLQSVIDCHHHFKIHRKSFYIMSSAIKSTKDSIADTMHGAKDTVSNVIHQDGGRREKATTVADETGSGAGSVANNAYTSMQDKKTGMRTMAQGLKENIKGIKSTP